MYKDALLHQRFSRTDYAILHFSLYNFVRKVLHDNNWVFIVTGCLFFKTFFHPGLVERVRRLSTDSLQTSVALAQSLCWLIPTAWLDTTRQLLTKKSCEVRGWGGGGGSRHGDTEIGPCHERSANATYLLQGLISVMSCHRSRHIKPDIHTATDCNATSRRSQSQIPDTVRSFLATICRVASCRNLYVGELQVQESIKTCLTSFILSPMGVRLSVALQIVAVCIRSSCRYLNETDQSRLNLQRHVRVSCYVYASF